MNLNSDAWRNLVFEGKNQEYGAYYLRKTSTKRHLYALAIGFCLVVIVTMSSFFFSHQRTSETSLQPVNLSELNMMTEVYLQQPTDPNIAKELPKEVQKPTPPEVVKDEEEIIESENKIYEEAITTEFTNGTDTTLITDFDLPKESAENIQDELVTHILDGSNSVPEFQVLQTAILRHVYQNIRYPDVAYKQRIKGQVIYSFIIEKDGSISEITLVRGVYIFLDEEVLRVIKSISKQEPVKKEGNPIRVKLYLPVTFLM